MKKISVKSTGLIRRNVSTQGETIENKIERIVSNKEPISDGAPLIYTDRKDGVQPDYDIRTDRFEYAIEAMDIVSRQSRAKRIDIPDNKTESGKTESVKTDSVKTESGEV